MSAEAVKTHRPWWLEPIPLGFAGLLALAAAAVVFEDKLVPPKPVDPRDHVTLAGGATFCDPVPLPPGQRREGTVRPPAK